MKNLTKSNTYLKFLVVLATFMLGFATIFTQIQPSFAPDEANGGTTTQTGTTEYSLNNLETKATTTIGNVQKTVVKVAGAVGTLAIIVTLALMLFTHDDRKIAGYIKICVTIAIAMAIILLVNANAILNLVQELTGENGF